MVSLDAIKKGEKGLAFSDVTNTCYRLLVDSSMLGKNSEYFYFRLAVLGMQLRSLINPYVIIQWLLLET